MPDVNPLASICDVSLSRIMTRAPPMELPINFASLAFARTTNLVGIASIVKVDAKIKISKYWNTFITISSSSSENIKFKITSENCMEMHLYSHGIYIFQIKYYIDAANLQIKHRELRINECDIA